MVAPLYPDPPHCPYLVCVGSGAGGWVVDLEVDEELVVERTVDVADGGTQCVTVSMTVSMSVMVTTVDVQLVTMTVTMEVRAEVDTGGWVIVAVWVT